MATNATDMDSSEDLSTPRLLDKRLGRTSSVSEDSSSPINKKGRVEQEVALQTLSNPPSMEELRNYSDCPIDLLPKMHKRPDKHRIFCNRPVDLEKIKYFGFDMDYTLAIYTNDIYVLTYNLVIQRLVKIGYPKEIASFSFDASFPIRGLLFDTMYGNLLKLDAFGHILVAYHARKQLTQEELFKQYPAAFVNTGDLGSDRYYVLNTLFNIPETSLYADLVDFFDTHAEYKRTADMTGVEKHNQVLSYHCLFSDVRGAVDYVHAHGGLKQEVMANPDKYIEKYAELPILLDRMRTHGSKVFLATNSDYHYTRHVMTYLFDVELPEGYAKKDWKEYFDLIICSACKPDFFGEGTMLREVDQETEAVKIGQFVGVNPHNRVFSGGSAEIVTSMLGAHGDDVLYIGDHIFGDVLKSKKLRGWRTFLVVPEMGEEMSGIRAGQEATKHLRNLEFMLAEVFRGLASEADVKPDITALTAEIKKTSTLLDCHFNDKFGSLFKSGSRQSFFAMQTARYADLYARTFLNLLYYPFFYQFMNKPAQLPHELVQDIEVDAESEYSPVKPANK